MSKADHLSAPFGGATAWPDGGPRDNGGSALRDVSMCLQPTTRDRGRAPRPRALHGTAADVSSELGPCANAGPADPGDAPAAPTGAVQALWDLWWRLDVALSPAIGHGGGRSVFRHSLRRASAVHPWLAGATTDALVGAEAIGSRPLACGRVEGDAARARDTVLHMAHRLLADLVGPRLTARLLGPVWRDVREPARQGPARERP